MRKLLDVINTEPAQSPPEKVRQLVWALLPTGRCSLEVVAQHLGMDRRTLHRHLQRDGQSFSEILDDVRCDLAIRYLTQQDRPFKDLAELLGFSELSAFSRWFTRRYGCTATLWREHPGGVRLPPNRAPAQSRRGPSSRVKAGRT
jgi:AraC-like DNA-binding protein